MTCCYCQKLQNKKCHAVTILNLLSGHKVEANTQGRKAVCHSAVYCLNRNITKYARLYRQVIFPHKFLDCELAFCLDGEQVLRAVSMECHDCLMLIIISICGGYIIICGAYTLLYEVLTLLHMVVVALYVVLSVLCMVVILLYAVLILLYAVLTPLQAVRAFFIMWCFFHYAALFSLCGALVINWCFFYYVVPLSLCGVFFIMRCFLHYVVLLALCGAFFIMWCFLRYVVLFSLCGALNQFRLK